MGVIHPNSVGVFPSGFGEEGPLGGLRQLQTFQGLPGPPAAPAVQVIMVDRLRGDIDVTWTSLPGEEIASWELRTSLTPIETEADWDDATVVGTYPGAEGPPVVELRLLPFGETTYMAVRATDSDGQTSELGTASYRPFFEETIFSTGLTTPAALVVAGDLSGDGRTDVVVGSAQSGVLIVTGLLDDGELVVTPLASPISGGQFGATIVAPGDVNGNGADDLLVFARTAPVDDATNAGIGFLYFGRTDGSLPESPDVEIILGAQGAIIGESATRGRGNLFDVGDEQLNDIVVGTRRSDGGRGYVFVIAGREQWPSVIELSFDAHSNAQQGVLTIAGNDATQGFGTRTAIVPTTTATDVDASPSAHLVVTSLATGSNSAGLLNLFTPERLDDLFRDALNSEGVVIDSAQATSSFSGEIASSDWGGTGSVVTAARPLFDEEPSTLLVTDSANRIIDVLLVSRDGTVVRRATIDPAISAGGTRIFPQAAAILSNPRNLADHSFFAGLLDFSAPGEYPYVFSFTEEGDSDMTSYVDTYTVNASAAVNCGTTGAFSLCLLDRNGNLVILR